MEPARSEVPVHLRWTDLDAYGHVHHARQLIMLEDARNRWLDSLFHDAESWAYAVVRIEFDYREQLGYEPEGALCAFSVLEVGRSSIRLAEELLRPDGVLVTEGRSVIVAWDEPSATARALSESEREVFAALGDG